jgi:peroxiredoxin
MASAREAPRHSCEARFHAFREKADRSGDEEALMARLDRRTLTASIEDPAGAERVPLSPGDVRRLQEVLAASGLPDVPLVGRYSIVFVYPGMGVGNVYPELAGCTSEVCTFIEEASICAQYGIQVVGLSGEPSEAPEGCIAIPFPVGLLPQGEGAGLIDWVDMGPRRYTVRASYLVYPDGTGERIGRITDVVAHVKRCLEVLTARQLESRHRAVLARLQEDPSAARSSIARRQLLPRGADSVAIERIDLTFELVCKLASPAVVAEEARYMDLLNRLLVEHDRPPLFPGVVAVCTDEDPAWYLREMVRPAPLDQLVFTDRARTRLDPGHEHLVTAAMAKLANLHEVTFRPEVPPAARYLSLDRFRALPARPEFREAFALLFPRRSSLRRRLSARVQLDGGFTCGSYEEQVGFLEANAQALLQPIAASLHGEAHLQNLLLDRDGRNVVFVNPRTSWDGVLRGPPDLGDPLFDFGTLLQSLQVMSAVLRAIDDDQTDDLLEVHEEGSPGRPALSVSGGLLRLFGHETVDWFGGWLERIVPAELLGQHWRARLHVAAASALLGWLPQAHRLQTREAWTAVFVALLLHLELARLNLEHLGDAEGPR